MNPEQSQKARHAQELSSGEAIHGESKESREKSFSRRALLLWSLPAAAVGLTALSASQAGAEYYDHGDSYRDENGHGYDNHTDHGDTAHADEGTPHIDSYENHSDYPPHVDNEYVNHYDYYQDHDDIHIDHDDSEWGLSGGHTDTHEDYTDSYQDHDDIHTDHTDEATGHDDVPHGDYADGYQDHTDDHSDHTDHSDIVHEDYGNTHADMAY